MRRKVVVLLSLLVIASMMLAACGGGAPAPAAQPAAEAPAAEAAATEVATEAAAADAAAEVATEAPTEAPVVLVAPAEVMEGRIPVRWFVGLGTGTDPVQIPIEQKVVDAFNASQDKIQLILEVVVFAGAKDVLSTQIASGNGPDIVGPVGWGGSNAYYGQWLDLTDLMKNSNYDTSVFNEALVKFYQTEEGQVGLPFAVFPGATFFQTAMFDEAGLNYPPAKYGEMYKLPGGKEVEWSWETLTNIAKVLTVDANGISPLELNASDEFVANPDFDKTKIVQYGYAPQFQSLASIGTFWTPGRLMAEDGKTAQIPETWAAAWKWYYDGMWGDQPFIATGPVSASPEFGTNNPFNGGKVAMGVTQMWYTCCIQNASESWDLAVQPSYNGEVHGRVDADTFRIWKGTKNPEAAFEVLSYLIGPASLELLSAYSGMPARTADQDAFFAGKAQQYPFVKNWDAIRSGLSYPDNPTSEAYTPNWTEADARMGTLNSLMSSTPDLDLDAEFAKVQADLQTIFDKAATK